MLTSTQALQAAAGALQQISDANPGERGRRASIVALVLSTLGRAEAQARSPDFLFRRAVVEVEGIMSRTERAYLRRMLDAGLEGGSSVMVKLLTEYASALENARRLPEADAVLGLARSFEPARADLALRAGRVARLQGVRAKALEMYALACALDAGDGSIARLSAIGEAVADGSEFGISYGIRAAVTAGDHEAAGVGLEERGLLRRSRGDRRGAARDFAVAAVRYSDPVDRARVAHLLADLYIAAGDPLAAREALLLALEAGDRPQRDHARARLHAVCRDLGDQLGTRRWRSFDRPALVSLSARPGARVAITSAPAVIRWRERMARFALGRAE